jgi:hypothetical protein
MRYRFLFGIADEGTYCMRTVRGCGCWDLEVGNEGDGKEGFDVCNAGTTCLLFGE